MCRNIKTLFNFEPPATDEEIRAASLQFVRKIGGSSKPSKLNEAAYDDAVERFVEVWDTVTSRRLRQVAVATGVAPRAGTGVAFGAGRVDLANE